MSRYTTEVRFICETLAGYDMSKGYGKVSEIINNSWDKIFDFDFPIFDENYRPVLCKKILRHYYTREIAFETIGLWKLKLEDKMNIIMPYYNKYYLSENINFNPLNDTDYTVQSTRDTSGEGGETGAALTTYGKSTTRNNTRYDLFSDTPQGALTGVNNETYLTNAEKITDNGGGSTSGTDRVDTERGTNFSNTDEYVEHIAGKRSSVTYSKLIQEFRETFLNIDKKVIDELNDLFFGLWI